MSQPGWAGRVYSGPMPRLTALRIVSSLLVAIAVARCGGSTSNTSTTAPSSTTTTTTTIPPTQTLPGIYSKFGGSAAEKGRNFRPVFGGLGQVEGGQQGFDRSAADPS